MTTTTKTHAAQTCGQQCAFDVAAFHAFVFCSVPPQLPDDCNCLRSGEDEAIRSIAFRGGGELFLTTVAEPQDEGEEEKDAYGQFLVTIGASALLSATTLLLSASASTVAHVAGASYVPPSLLFESSVSVSCMPLFLPSSALLGGGVPLMSAESWTASKRALAFCRGLAIVTGFQGILAVVKFTSGDLVGGFFDGIMAGLGFWSTREDGVQMLPSYIMFSGFNGIIYLLQVVQSANGIPFQYVVTSGALIRPAMCLTGAYFGWQFLKELQAIASGFTGAGDQDSCFVNLLAGDNVVAEAASSVTGAARSAQTEVRRSFTRFSGEGHRLGSQDTSEVR